MKATYEGCLSHIGFFNRGYQGMYYVYTSMMERINNKQFLVCGFASFFQNLKLFFPFLLWATEPARVSAVPDGCGSIYYNV